MFCLQYSVIYKPSYFGCIGGMNLFSIVTDLSAGKAIHEQPVFW